MSNKLTKNDSMPVENAISDLKSKNVQTNFDVLVATFEAILKNENIHQAYFREWEISNDYQGTANVFYAWREWAKRTDPTGWIMGAFTWRHTIHGRDTWYRMNEKWYKYYRRNIKK